MDQASSQTNAIIISMKDSSKTTKKMDMVYIISVIEYMKGSFQGVNLMDKADLLTLMEITILVNS